MTDVIERYVATALDRIPEDRRQDVGRDIRGAIDEMVTPRVENGEPEDAAIRAVLTELGDPVRLAASYHERRNYLIGPGWYPTYIEVMKRVLTIALPVITVIAMLVTVADSESDLADVLESGIGSLFEVGIQVLFWVTLGFIIAERTMGPDGPAPRNRAWSVDDLPERPALGRQIGIGETLLSVITMVVFGVLAFVQWDNGIGAFARGINESYERLPLLNPDLGTGWVAGFYALVTISIVAAVVRYISGYWTGAMLAMTVVESGLWTIYVVALAVREPIFNADLAQRIDDSSNTDWWAAGGSANWIAAIIVIAINAWEVWEAWQGSRELERQRQLTRSAA
jgi:hypothetical protein